MFECPICLEDHPKLYPWSSCQHLFCDNCIQQWSLLDVKKTCPMCRTPRNESFLILDIIKRIINFLTVIVPEHWECFSDFMVEQRIIL